MTAPALLALRGVGHRFRVGGGFLQPSRHLQALDDVDLAVARGETLGLVGESGSGKSTAARVMLGLLRPETGRVELDGAPLEGLSRLAIARRVQPVFQDPYASLNPARTVEAIVRLGLEVHGIGADTTERRDRVAAMLDLVGLSPRLAASHPAALSGGQRQRVAIARALVIEPDVLICDEPTSALDVSVQAQILNLLLDLRARLGLTIVLISHNLAVVEHLADRVAVMYLGRIVETAPVARLFRAPRHPYAQALLASALAPDPVAARRRVPLLGAPADPLNRPAGCAFHPRCPHALPLCRTQTPALGAAGAACHLPSSDTPSQETEP
ncbi:MAG: ABC transporter ATP-binding protein [Alphaproteobacteria bacterium]|nr:ABC transporter ATP-binding protein [Alphaproteobacteria bacterium]